MVERPLTPETPSAPSVADPATGDAASYEGVTTISDPRPDPDVSEGTAVIPSPWGDAGGTQKELEALAAKVVV